VFFLVFAIGIIASGVTHAVSVTASSADHLVTIHDGGIKKVILSNATTVGGAIKQAGMSVDGKDLVEPALNDKLIASTYQVNIYRARPVLIVDGNVRQEIITAFQTPQQITASAGIVLYPEDKTTIDPISDLSEGVGLQLTIHRATPFIFTLYGKTTTVRTQATTVGGMLTEKGIKLTKDDRVVPDVGAKLTSGMTVNLWREGKQTVTVTQPIAFQTQKIADADRAAGYLNITTTGVNGVSDVTYEVTIVNGQEIARTEIASLTVKPAVTQIEDVGTASAYSGSLEEWLLQLRTCESSGNYQEDTGNGYYGAYQFSQATWDSLGTGYAFAYEAPPAVQDAMIIKNTNQSSGGLATQNPGCFASQGLSAFPPQ
jgi:uncharacterized protein YabE (DUF348 family)